MCAQQHTYAGLEFTHLVVFPKDSAVYASARQSCCGKIRIFLIFSSEDGSVYSRNGREDSWEEVAGERAKEIRALARKVQYNRLAPVYTANTEFAWQ